MRKRENIDPSEILLCVASHHAGGHSFYAEGSRVRKGDIEVYSAPYWAKDGITQLELARLRHALEGSSVPQPEPTPAPVPKMRAKRGFTAVRNTVAGGGSAPSTVMFAIAVGDTFAAGDPIVSEYPDAFEPVKN